MKTGRWFRQQRPVCNNARVVQILSECKYLHLLDRRHHLMEVRAGRIRIANQLKPLGIFLSASTVRNILQQPKPRGTPAAPASPENAEEKPEVRSIPAWYPTLRT
jgi:hypothetical protein